MRDAVAPFIGIVSVLFVMGTAEIAVAQTPIGEIGGGYQFVWDNELEESFPTGWFVTGAGNLTDSVAVVGEVSGSHKSEGGIFGDADLNLYTYMGGVRVAAPGTVRPFFQFLAGVARATATIDVVGFQVDDSLTEFAIQPGGGVDIFLTDGLAVRLMVDYRRIFAEDEDGNEIRAAAGIVVGLGSR